MRTTLGTLVILLLSGSAAASAADPLGEITRTIEGQARRASSGLFDPESNEDACHVAPGETVTLTTLPGPGEIRHMWFTIAGRDRRYPRTLVLRIYWDGAESPSVETPIGDFFAAGNGMRANVNTLPIQVTSYGRALNCYWRMPFRKQARIELTNEGRNTLTVYWQFDWMELPRAADDMLYFHARYRQEFPAKPFSPYVIFDGRGEGHYVGTVFSIQCSYGSWFGESDDRFYIDGEAEPSIVGTGCEDFFNDAWNLRLFTNANTGVTIKEPNGEDCRFTAYRWHIQAPVTFRKSLKVEIERRSFAAVTEPGDRREPNARLQVPAGLLLLRGLLVPEDGRRAGGPLPARRRADQSGDLPGNGGHGCRDPDLAGRDGQTPQQPRLQSASGRCTSTTRRRRLVRGPLPRRAGGQILDLRVPVPVPDRRHLESDAGGARTARSCWIGDWISTIRTLAWKENRPENFLYGTWFEKKLGIHKLTPGDYVFRFECVGANPLSPSRRLGRARLELPARRHLPSPLPVGRPLRADAAVPCRRRATVRG